VLGILYSWFHGWAKFEHLTQASPHAYQYLSGENLRMAAAVPCVAISVQLAKKAAKGTLISESVTFFRRSRCTFLQLAYKAG
jgi:hypothetical protein